MMSVEVVRLKSGAFNSSMLLKDKTNDVRVNSDGDNDSDKNIPALLLVELVTHVFRELFKFTLGPGIVGVNHEVLEVP